MIPKKIHYCWLSEEKMPRLILESIRSWQKVMPDYELILWDKNRFDINSVPWVAEACSVKKWAFASDYIRLYAIYTEGGIYLDTDVYVFKCFDDLLYYDFFTSCEFKNPTKIFKDVINSNLDDIQTVGDIQIEAAIFGGIQRHPFFGDCMNWYKKRHYILSNGEYNQKAIAPQIYTAILQNYGFRYIDEKQILQNNMIVFPQGSKFYSPIHNTSMDKFHANVYAVHWHAAAWIFKKNIFQKIFIKIKHNTFIRKIFKKKPIVTIDSLTSYKTKITRNIKNVSLVK